MPLSDSTAPVRASASSVTAIVGGHVVPVDGAPIPGGTVLLRDGLVAAVGADVEVPEGDPDMSSVRAIDAIDIDDEGFRDALKGGVTTIVVKPGSGNPIGGQSVAIKSWGGRTIDEQLVSDSVSVKSALGENPKRVYGAKDRTPSTRLGVAMVIRRAFRDAEDYRAARDHAAKEGKPFSRDLGKETLVRVLDGELAWDQHTHRHDDIATAIRLADEFGYRLVVNHGTEGDKIADVLAERGIPVIFGPMITSRSKVELRDRAVANLAALHRAGVLVAITTDAPVVPIDFLVHQASFAVKEACPPTSRSAPSPRTPPRSSASTTASARSRRASTPTS
jgi:imidazolonepropionase-like amidohydrolase